MPSLTFAEALRESMSMSGADLARISGVSEATISRILAGTQSPTLNVVYMLEQALPKLRAMRNKIEA